MANKINKSISEDTKQEFLVEIGSKDEINKEQWEALKNNFVQRHMNSPFYRSEKFTNLASKAGVSLEKFWELNFSTRLRNPSEYCVFARPASNLTKIVAVMSAQKVHEDTIYLYSWSVLPEYQNMGLTHKMGRKVIERFPNTNIVLLWCVKSDPHTRRNGTNTDVQKKAKKEYLYYVLRSKM
eukprot:Phypoly_transcript_12037.p1 GENE.Phypoly_transcript_12037~~Phypoly_transcript_12037.p1  ORF type:complete len:182 (+),score=24.05 Phypoly_transcript_12037:516-1061(+)